MDSLVAERTETAGSYARRLGLETQPIRRGLVELWPAEHQAFLAGERLPLTPREFEVLHVLVAAAGHVIAKHRVRLAVWGTSSSANPDRSVDVYVAKLRRKLAAAAPEWEFIHTHMQIGLRFDPQRRAGGPTT